MFSAGPELDADLVLYSSVILGCQLYGFFVTYLLVAIIGLGECGIQSFVSSGLDPCWHPGSEEATVSSSRKIKTPPTVSTSLPECYRVC